MMPHKTQDVLAILKSELEFIEKGGYGNPGTPHPAGCLTMFADSLTCLNYGYPYRTHPCGECPLMGFVPEEDRLSAMPCHYIPLDSSGRTIEEMEKAGNEAGMQEAVKGWLRDTIQHIEAQRSA